MGFKVIKLMKSSGLTCLMLQYHMIRCTFDVPRCRLVLNSTALWFKMGSSAEVMLYGVMPEQQTKSRIWCLVWVVKLTYCFKLKQSNCLKIFSQHIGSVI